MKLELTPEQAVLVHYLVNWGISYSLYSKYDMQVVADALSEMFPSVHGGTAPKIATPIDVTEALVSHLQKATRLTPGTVEARLLALTDRHERGHLSYEGFKEEACGLIRECWDINASAPSSLWDAANASTITWADHMAKFIELCDTFPRL